MARLQVSQAMVLVWVPFTAPDRGRAKPDKPPAGGGGLGLSAAAGKSGSGLTLIET